MSTKLPSQERSAEVHDDVCTLGQASANNPTSGGGANADRAWDRYLPGLCLGPRCVAGLVRCSVAGIAIAICVFGYRFALFIANRLASNRISALTLPRGEDAPYVGSSGRPRERAGMLVLYGCRGDSSRPNRNAMSPAEYFNKSQANTVSPHARIKAGSAESSGNGQIRYQTEDGNKWEVTATPDGDGYRYSGVKAVG